MTYAHEANTLAKQARDAKVNAERESQLVAIERMVREACAKGLFHIKLPPRLHKAEGTRQALTAKHFTVQAVAKGTLLVSWGAPRKEQR